MTRERRKLQTADLNNSSFHKYYSSDQINEDEIDGARSMHGTDEKCL